MDLKNAVERLFNLGCIPSARAWTNEKEQAVQDVLDALKGHGMVQPESEYFDFLERVATGCVSGRFAEWPQLKPACEYAVKKLNQRHRLLFLTTTPCETKDQLIARVKEILSS